MDVDDYRAAVFDSMKDHLNYAESKDHKIIGIFLQGSQNYNLQTEFSDVDTKAIVLPSFKSIIVQGKKTSSTLVLPNNEHCDVKDISCMYDCFTKSNINFLEILFTDFKMINPEYQSEITELCTHAEEIALYDYKKLVNSIIGMAMEKRKALTHPYPATIHKIEKYGYDGKQLHHILRLEEFLYRLEIGESFRECLKTKIRDELIPFKINPLLTVEEAIELSDRAIVSLKRYREDSFMYKNATQNKAVKEFLDDSMYRIMEKSIIQELADAS